MSEFKKRLKQRVEENKMKPLSVEQIDIRIDALMKARETAVSKTPIEKVISSTDELLLLLEFYDGLCYEKTVFGVRALVDETYLDRLEEIEAVVTERIVSTMFGAI